MLACRRTSQVRSQPHNSREAGVSKETSGEWLKFNNRDLSLDSKKEFKKRLVEILKKEIERLEALDIKEFASLHNGIKLQNLNQFCHVSFMQDDRTFTCQALNSLFRILEQLGGEKQSMMIRHSRKENVTLDDLFLLHCMDGRVSVDVPWHVAKFFVEKAKGYKKKSPIVGAYLIGRIAMLFGLMTPGALRGVNLGLETSLLNVAKLVDLGICKYNALGYGKMVDDVPKVARDEGAGSGMGQAHVGGIRHHPNMTTTNRLQAIDERCPSSMNSFIGSLDSGEQSRRVLDIPDLGVQQGVNFMTSTPIYYTSSSFSPNPFGLVMLMQVLPLPKTNRMTGTKINLHPRLHDPALTMDCLPNDTMDRRAIPDYLTWRHLHSFVSDDLPIDGYDWNDVERLCARVICLYEMRDEVLVLSGLSSIWLNKKCDLVFRKKADDSDEVIAAQSDPRLVRKSKGLCKGKVEGLDDMSDFWIDVENSLEITGSTPARAVSASTPYLVKILGPPPSSLLVAIYEPLQIGGSVHASTFGHDFAWRGSATSGFAGNPRAEDVRCCLDPLDTLAHSALSCDSEYDQIPEDDFAIASRGEEIDLTLFPLALGPYVIRYLFDGNPSPPYSRQQWDGPHAPEDNILAKEIFKDPNVYNRALDHLNNHYSNLVNCKSRTQEKLDRKTKELHSQNDALSEEVKRLQSQLANAKDFTMGLSDELAWTDVKLADYALVVRDLQNELALERLLSSDEFHAALDHVVSLGIASGVKKGLHMGCTDVEFEVASQIFPFLDKVTLVAKGPLFEVTQIVLKRLVFLAGSVSNVVVSVSGIPNQALVDQASDNSPIIA
ncbi:hypothetical protein Tco_0396078 [Tanacetum coccineum]